MEVTALELGHQSLCHDPCAPAGAGGNLGQLQVQAPQRSSPQDAFLASKCHVRECKLSHKDGLIGDGTKELTMTLFGDGSKFRTSELPNPH